MQASISKPEDEHMSPAMAMHWKESQPSRLTTHRQSCFQIELGSMGQRFFSFLLRPFDVAFPHLSPLGTSRAMLKRIYQRPQIASDSVDEHLPSTIKVIIEISVQSRLMLDQEAGDRDISVDAAYAIRQHTAYQAMVFTNESKQTNCHPVIIFSPISSPPLLIPFVLLASNSSGNQDRCNRSYRLNPSGTGLPRVHSQHKYVSRSKSNYHSRNCEVFLHQADKTLAQHLFTSSVNSRSMPTRAHRVQQVAA